MHANAVSQVESGTAECGAFPSVRRCRGNVLAKCLYVFRAVQERPSVQKLSLDIACPPLVPLIVALFFGYHKKHFAVWKRIAPVQTKSTKQVVPAVGSSAVEEVE